MLYKYFCLTAEKKVVSGLIAIKTEDQARQRLGAKGWTVYVIHRINLFPSLFHKVRKLDILFFLKNLALLLKSGISLGEALEGSAQLIKSRYFKKAVLAISQEVNAGNSLSNVLSQHQDLFSQSIINLFNIGEESGTLADIVQRVAENEDSSFELRKKMRASAAYPIIILSITVLLLIAFFIFVLPRFTVLFQSIGSQVPPSISFFMSLGQYISQHGVLSLIIAVVVIYLWRLLVRVPQFSQVWNTVLLQIPVVNSVIRDTNLGLINRMMGVLIISGVDAVKALHITAGSINNGVYVKALLKVSIDVESGQSIQSSLAKQGKIFPSLELLVLNAGEKSGNLGQAFEYMAAFYFRELDYSTKTLSVVLEPALLLLVGIVIGALALSIITPIYDFVSTVGG